MFVLASQSSNLSSLTSPPPPKLTSNSKHNPGSLLSSLKDFEISFRGLNPEGSAEPEKVGVGGGNIDGILTPKLRWQV